VSCTVSSAEILLLFSRRGFQERTFLRISNPALSTEKRRKSFDDRRMPETPPGGNAGAIERSVGESPVPRRPSSAKFPQGLRRTSALEGTVPRACGLQFTVIRCGCVEAFTEIQLHYQQQSLRYLPEPVLLPLPSLSFALLCAVSTLHFALIAAAEPTINCSLSLSLSLSLPLYVSTYVRHDVLMPL
jgi:hypothetical protein